MEANVVDDLMFIKNHLYADVCHRPVLHYWSHHLIFCLDGYLSPLTDSHVLEGKLQRPTAETVPTSINQELKVRLRTKDLRDALKVQGTKKMEGASNGSGLIHIIDRHRADKSLPAKKLDKCPLEGTNLIGTEREGIQKNSLHPKTSLASK